MRAFLWQIGGREVHRDLARGQRDGERAECRADAFAGLGHRLVGQSDDGKAGQAVTDRALHLDQAALDPLKGDRICDCNHALPRFAAR